MKLHRFYIPGASQRLAHITDPSILHQWRNVLRFKPGMHVVLFSGDQSESEYVITDMEKSQAIIEFVSRKGSLERPRDITLYPAMVKKDKLEWVIQKCTELGVSAFQPILTGRSEKLGFNRDRLERILIEATEQSGWGSVPELRDPLPLDRAILEAQVPLVVLDMNGEKSLPSRKPLGLLIGPEGGWSDDEQTLFAGRSIPVVSLGLSTLRAETACITASSLALLS